MTKARWDEWKRKLSSDKRWRAYSLNEHDKERLFEEHIKNLEEVSFKLKLLSRPFISLKYVILFIAFDLYQ